MVTCGVHLGTVVIMPGSGIMTTGGAWLAQLTKQMIYYCESVPKRAHKL